MSPINGDQSEELDSEELDNPPKQIHITTIGNQPKGSEKLRRDLGILKNYYEENNTGLSSLREELSWPEVIRQSVLDRAESLEGGSEKDAQMAKLVQLTRGYEQQLEIMFEVLQQHPQVMQQVQQKVQQEKQSEMNIQDIANADINDIVQMQ